MRDKLSGNGNKMIKAKTPNPRVAKKSTVRLDPEVERSVGLLAENAAGIAHAIHRLGTNNAFTSMGAIEALGVTVQENAGATGAIADHLQSMVLAIEGHAEATQAIADAIVRLADVVERSSTNRRTVDVHLSKVS